MALPLETTIITRGVVRLLHHRGLDAAVEIDLPNGRRADVMGIDRLGGIVIVETKVTLIDLLRDAKWPEYRDYCDAFFIAVPPNFAMERVPDGVGVIVADRFGGEVILEAPLHKIGAATRKVVLVDFARTAARRLARALDPGFDELP
jgi:hypothetical protein